MNNALASEIKALGQLPQIERENKLRAGAATLGALGTDGLEEMLEKHGRGVTAVLVAGAMMSTQYCHLQTPRDLDWAREVREAYGTRIRVKVEPVFNAVYLYKFAEMED